MAHRVHLQPSEKIRTMKTWLKTELHTHTIDDPKDGNRIVFHSAHELIDKAQEQGFEVLSITNHEEVFFSLSLEKYARERGILLIPGVEASLRGKHVLLYNFSNYDPSWNRPEIVAQSKGSEQLVIAPHPFFPSSASLGKLVSQWQELFDAIEYNHFYLAWLNFNQPAEKLSQRLSLPLVGASDVHRLCQLGRTYSLVYAERDIGSVLQAIKRGHVRVVSQPASPFFIAQWFGLNALSKARKMITRPE